MGEVPCRAVRGLGMKRDVVPMVTGRSLQIFSLNLSVQIAAICLSKRAGRWAEWLQLNKHIVNPWHSSAISLALSGSVP